VYEQSVIIILRAVQIPFFKNIKSPHIKKYASNTGWLFADNFIKQGINLIVGIFLARYLNPEGFGIIGYASTYIQLLNPIALLGLNAIAIKEIVNKEESIESILGTTFLLKIISSVFSLFLIVVIAFLGEVDTQIQMYIIIIGLSYLVYPIQVVDYYFQANLKAKYTVISQQIATITCAALKVWGIINQYPIVFFVWLISIEVFIIAFVQIFFYRTKTIIPKWNFNNNLAKRMLKESFPIIFTGFFIIIYMRIDQLMIQKMLNSEALGNFVAAIKLSEAFYVVPGIIAGSLFPAIINGLKISRDEYLSRMKRLYSIFILICFAATIFVLIFADIIVSVLFGEAYTDTASVLRVHFSTSVFVFLGIAYSQAFIVEHMQRFTTINTVVGALLNICLNWLFIPIFGVVGSAFATLAAQFYSGFLCLLLFPKTRVHFILMLQSFNVFSTIAVYYKKISNLKDE